MREYKTIIQTGQACGPLGLDDAIHVQAAEALV